jgi:hypothetical protein
MVARKSSKSFVAEDVDGLPLAAVAHRRGQGQRDPHPTARAIPGSSVIKLVIFVTGEETK